MPLQAFNMRLQYLFLFLIMLLNGLNAKAQDETSAVGKITSFPTRFLDKLNKKSAELEDKLVASSEKALERLAKQEKKLKKKLARNDSAAAEQLFGNVEERYKQLQSKLQQPVKLNGRAGQYLPHLDTLKTSLNFLSQNNELLANSSEMTGKVKEALNSVKGLEGKFDQAADVKKYLRDRKQMLKEQLNRFGLTKELKKYNQQAYYYAEQVNSYKAMLEDPSKLEQKALELVKKIPAFQDFFKKHSELASLFRLPDNYGSTASLAGLQTRSSVQNLIQERIASAGPNATAMLQQNVQAAQAQLSGLKDKLNELGGMGNSEGDLPDFKPNNQKTKSFLQRLEYGTNLQSQRSNNYFPTTTDIGLSVGYKLNDKSVIGVGASYKVGWGQNIRNISVSSQGVGFRSFADYKIKGSFFASGGFEYNYQQPFSSVSIVRDLDSWQQSGLAGISKVVSLKSKMFKKTKIQLLWDFLSYSQRPQTQPLKFRVGYNF
ncbi:hypothetical protein EV199_3859 [Pseudobacter ginsenosidimutans]|uniref:Uncharacterized protein n=2 Tax=Pseudobacter ginsenosidimutans TaxID=661488 RepID=A0A4Q7MSY2_9BACT|nr:hypothetical protein EV199_3859 [Pseudobacter ginsenosidimutans]